MKHIIVISLTLAFSVPAFAGIDAEMTSWFNELGAYGNVTGAQAIQGQTTTVYTGGGLYMRTPIKNYQLMSIVPPSVRAGCGGIDFFAGSFSFINSEQLTALLRNVANNAMGYAFMTAVKAISPDLADLIQYLQDQIAKINNMNLNSCQMAEGIVTGVGSLLTDNKEQTNAQGTGSTLSNLWSDSFQSFSTWREDKEAKKQARQQASASDPALKEKLNPGNITWQALAKTDAPSELKELMMSLVGTIIIIPVGEQGNENGSEALWIYKGPTGVKFTDFIGHAEAPTNAETSMYRCPESSECRDPTVVEGTATVTSLSYLVRKTMEKAKGNIEGRKKQSFTDLDKTIYLNSATPVWRLVNVAAMNKKTVDLITNNYSEIIATELAYAWFGEIARTLQKALSNYSIGKSPDAVTAGQNLTDSLAAVEAVAINEYGSKLSHATAMMTAQRDIQRLHETMMNAMSPELTRSLVTFNQ